MEATVQTEPTVLEPIGQRLLLIQLKPGKFQPRKRFDQVKLKELAASIAHHGVIQPILVRPVGSEFEIVAGERRWRASQLAGVPDIPVTTRQMTDTEALEVAVIENDQREDLHPLEEAEGFAALLEQYAQGTEAQPEGARVQQLADKIGKSRTHVYNRLKLLALVPELREQFLDGFIPTTLAEKLARMPMHLQPKALARLRKLLIDKGHDGDPLPVRSSISILKREFMLRLNAAPFSVKDGTLCPDAGACHTCPKRTGFEPDLFADVEHTDTCTDPVCYQAKVGAHNVLTKTKARSKGLEVIEGDGASALLKFGSTSDELNGDYVYMDRPLANLTGNDKPLKKLLGKYLQPSALFEHPKDKTLREIVQVTKAVDALRDHQLLINDPEANKRAKKAEQADFVGIETSVAGKREDITAPGPATVIELHSGGVSASHAEPEARLQPVATEPARAMATGERSFTEQDAEREHAWREQVFRGVHSQLVREWASPIELRLMVVEQLARQLNERTAALLASLWGWDPRPEGVDIEQHVLEEAKGLDDEELELLTVEIVMVADLYPAAWALNSILLNAKPEELPLTRACPHLRQPIDWRALAISAGSGYFADELQEPDLPHVSPPPAAGEKGDASQAGKPAEDEPTGNTSQAPQGAQGAEKDQSDLPHWVGQMVKIKETKRIGEVVELAGDGTLTVSTETDSHAIKVLNQFAYGEVEVLPGQVRPTPAQPAAEAPSGDGDEGAETDLVATKPKRLAAKYRNPLTGETWSGRGLQPKWLRVAIDHGARLDDFLL